MKRFALIAVFGLLCLCLAGCGSNAGAPGSSGNAASSSTSSSASPQSGSATSSPSVGDKVEISGSIISVTQNDFVVDDSGVHFTCIPADSRTLDYITAGNVVEVEGVITAIENNAVTLDKVYVDDYSDGYNDYSHHSDNHHEEHHD